MTKKRIHLIYGIFLSAAAILAGICLIVACVGIYRSGETEPFYAESVAAAFQKISIAVYICIAMVIGGFILHLCYPPEKEKAPIQKQYPIILERLQAKLDISACDPALQTAIAKERKKRKIHLFIAHGLLVVCSIAFLSYGLNRANFPEDNATESVISSMKLFLPCLAIPFGFGIFTAYHSSNSIRKEIELTKQALAGCNNAAAAISQKGQTTPMQNVVTYAILSVAIAFIIFGLLSNGAEEVFGKAAQLCKECVGLG